MAKLGSPPYLCHIFICTNDRQGARESCADQKSPELRAAIKQAVESRGLKPRVRVSASGCLGLCAQGPNVIIYPQKIWFAQVGLDDVELIMAKVIEIVE